MKSTGIVRRIDELGRVVIPKEIRKNLGIRDGENLEIYIEEDRIVLQKQMLMTNAFNISKTIVKIVSDIYNLDILITNRDSVVATNYNVANYINEKLPNRLIKLMDNRETYISEMEENVAFIKPLTGYFYICPIIIDADAIGEIIIRKTQDIKDEDINIVKFIREIISKKLSIS